MGKRKPSPVTEQKNHYKTACRHFFVCDKGHRFYEDWDFGFVDIPSVCPEDGCDQMVELDFYGPPTRCDGPRDGDPIVEVELPAHAPIRRFSKLDR